MKRPAPGEITRKTRIRIQSITVIVVSFFVSSRESRQGDRSKEQDASTYMSCNFQRDQDVRRSIPAGGRKMKWLKRVMGDG